jgi:hypothetical protein
LITEPFVKRIIILGGLGHFGQTAANELRRLGLACQIASRRGIADLQIEANDADSIRAGLRPNDVVLDAAGPFQSRYTALVASAIDIGFHVIDLNDDLRNAEAVLPLAPRNKAAGIRVHTSASTVSAVAAAFIRAADIPSPVRVSAFLAPASRHTASSGAALSLIRSVGRPIRVFRNGRLQQCTGWSEATSFKMPPPLNTIHGRLFESADALHLPRAWPMLREVAMYVDTNVPGGNMILRLAARSARLRACIERQSRFGTRIARTLGSAAGGIGYEIEDASGRTARCAIVADEKSFITAVAPAVLAVKAVAEDDFAHRGLVPPDLHCDPNELFAFLRSRGISIHT